MNGQTRTENSGADPYSWTDGRTGKTMDLVNRHRDLRLRPSGAQKGRATTRAMFHFSAAILQITIPYF